jgi:FkbM family methyltransferase
VTRLRRFLRLLLDTVGWRTLWLAGLIYRSPEEQEIRRREAQQAEWYAIDGDRTLRVVYPLDSGAVVVDAGAYHGDWAAVMIARYACRTEVFEPVGSFVEVLQRRFAANPLVTVHPYGLGARDETVELHVERGASSAVLRPTGSAVERGVLRDAAAWMAASPAIDLMKVNIEGGEYDLLERILEEGLMRRIRFLQVQFHDGLPDAEPRMRRIQAQLQRTHTLSWRYEWVWESWERRA